MSVNGVPVTKGNIIAGKAVIHQTADVLLPPDIQELLAAATDTSASNPDDFAGFMTDDAANATPAATTTAPNTGAVTSTTTGAGAMETVDVSRTDDASPITASTATSAGGAKQSGSTLQATPNQRDPRTSSAGRSAASTLFMVALSAPALLALLV